MDEDFSDFIDGSGFVVKVPLEMTTEEARDYIRALFE